MGNEENILLCLHLTLTYAPVLSPENVGGRPFLWQICSLRCVLAFCYYFSLLKLPLLFIFKAFLFDDKIVEKEGGVMCRRPLTPLAGLGPTHPGAASGPTQPAALGQFSQVLC